MSRAIHSRVEWTIMPVGYISKARIGWWWWVKADYLNLGRGWALTYKGADRKIVRKARPQ